ncbi:MAG: hypothetical protein J7605_17275 [Variovorax sp.]|nr:hypothetical protein [Variovorax sp.]
MPKPERPAPPLLRLHACEEQTYAEIGEALGLSRESIRKIEAKALSKAATMLAERGIAFEDVFGTVRYEGLPGRHFHRSD